MSRRGLLLNRYEVGTLLGQGGMAAVYHGTDTETGEPVAVKLLRPEKVADRPDMLERFAREAAALRVLDHPNIVKVLAAVEDEDQSYLVMEFVSGGSLRDLLDREGQLGVEHILEITLDLADALTRAHRLHIIHRDIKPANVLMAEDGTPRLTDFGLAHVGSGRDLTQEGAIIGTIDYLSPEACQGQKLDARADIWALGVMLYEMLVGARPFTHPTVAATLKAILNQPIPDLASLRQDAPTALVDLIYRMLKKDRRARISSVRLVGAEIEAIMQGKRTTTRQSSLVSPLLQTKLDIPPLRPFLVPRPHLLEMLNTSINGRLTLVSAPAGFGKTTLITAWVRQQDAPVAWLSLDKNDNDLRRFLTYLVVTCQQTLPDFDPDLLRLLQIQEQEIALEPALTTVLNELARVNTPIILVLDDYHVIKTILIHEAVTFFLDHQPPDLHLVITTRTEPPLPLSRLRARRQLTEINLNALRFTTEEANRFFRDLMGLPLSRENVATLTARTEGWPAGLQLAALALQSAAAPETVDPARFVASFSGSNRLVLDYLADEVLAQQPADTCDFLLHTAILNRFCAPLCDAVLGQEDGETDESISSQTMLEQLDAANLFILPLDHERRWYRYHTLFADLLRDRLQRTYPEKLPVLHRRASHWWAENGFAAEAIDHAFAANDETAAAGFIAEHAQEMVGRGEIVVLSGWLQRLSPAALHGHPRLGLSLVLSRLFAGTITGISDILDPLDTVEVQLQTSDLPERNQLQAEVNAVRAAMLVEEGETAAGLALAEPAAAELEADRSRYGRYLYAMLSATMGLAYRDQGNTETAVQAYASASKYGDNLLVALLAAYERGKLHQEMGQIHQAERVHRQAIDWVTAQFGKAAAALPLSGAAHIGLGRLLYERNRLDEARHHLLTGIERASQKGGLGIDRDGLLALALVRQAQGDSQEADRLMARAVDHARYSPRPDARLRAEARRVRMWLMQGNVTAATRWADQQAIDPERPAYPAEMTAVALARVYLAQQQPERALAILQSFLSVVEAGGRNGRLLEIWLLQALAHHQLGETEAALAQLQRSLSVAQPEGYIRPFLDAGQPLAQLLYAAVQQGIMADYSGSLLALFAEEQVLPAVDTLPQRDVPALVEPLSERELEVLQQVATGLTNREIGLRLHLSPNTIKRHTLNIYGKLGVHSRTEAVTTARSLGILT